MEGQEEPKVGVAEEGGRRGICDMTLLNLPQASTYQASPLTTPIPRSLQSLFSRGTSSILKEAVKYYERAMDSQKQYRNLHNISFWEMAIAHCFELWDGEESGVLADPREGGDDAVLFFSSYK